MSEQTYTLSEIQAAFDRWVATRPDTDSDYVAEAWHDFVMELGFKLEATK